VTCTVSVSVTCRSLIARSNGQTHKHKRLPTSPPLPARVHIVTMASIASHTFLHSAGTVKSSSSMTIWHFPSAVREVNIGQLQPVRKLALRDRSVSGTATSMLVSVVFPNLSCETNLSTSSRMYLHDPCGADIVPLYVT